MSLCKKCGKLIKEESFSSTFYGQCKECFNKEMIIDSKDFNGKCPYEDCKSSNVEIVFEPQILMNFICNTCKRRFYVRPEYDESEVDME